MSDYWRKTMEWLGLMGHDDHEVHMSDPSDSADRATARTRAARPARDARAPRGGSVSYLRGSDVEESAPEESPTGSAKVRRLQKSDPSERVIQSVSSPLSQMYVVEPRSIDDAQRIVDRLRSGEPVIMNLQATPSVLAQRLADFVNGAAYGLGGGAQPVADRVILVTPSSVEVSDEDRRRLREKGMFFTLARKQSTGVAEPGRPDPSVSQAQASTSVDERGEHLSDDISSWRQREQGYRT